MSANAAIYIERLRKLFPRGRAWPEAKGPNWTQLLASLAEECARVDCRADDLIRESDPRTCFETLPDWEEMLGLPDACLGSPETINERRALVIALLLLDGGQTPEYFEYLGALFERDIRVEEAFPARAGWAVAGARCHASTRAAAVSSTAGCRLVEAAAPFYWTIHSDAVEAQIARAGAAQAGDRVRDWGDRRLECLIERFRPAHTQAIHIYNAADAVAKEAA